MVKNCGICCQRGDDHMRVFPSNSLPLKQELWMDRLNLLPEERTRLLERFREELGRTPPVRTFWCSRHFDGQPDPIDVRNRCNSAFPRPLSFLHNAFQHRLPIPDHADSHASLPLLTRQVNINLCRYSEQNQMRGG